VDPETDFDASQMSRSALEEYARYTLGRLADAQSDLRMIGEAVERGTSSTLRERSGDGFEGHAETVENYVRVMIATIVEAHRRHEWGPVLDVSLAAIHQLDLRRPIDFEHRAYLREQLDEEQRSDEP
jgi:hypothetical protein